MPPLYGTLRLRPTRIGFLVHPSQQSLSTVREVMRLCCCLWGGSFNPIIPVMKVLPAGWKEKPYQRLSGAALTDGYLRFFEPDVFVETEEGLAETAGIKSDPIRIRDRRIIKLEEFVQLDEVRRPDFAYGLNIFELYSYLYNRELQFVPRHDRRFAVFAPLLPRQDAFVEAVFGVFPGREDLAYIRQAYLDAFDPKVFEPEPSGCLEIFQQGYSSPLRVSRYNIEREPNAQHDPIIYIFDPSKTIDLIDFWNLRQFSHDVLPIHIDWFKELTHFIRGNVEHNCRPLPRNPHGVMIHTTVEFARSIPQEMAEQLARDSLAGLPQGSWSLKFWYDPIWRDGWRTVGIQPRRAKLSAETTNIDANISESDNTFEFQALAPEFAEEYGHWDNQARWANVLRLNDYGQRTPLAITYLPNTKAPGFPRLRLGKPTIISREGIIFLQHYRQDRGFVTPLSQQDAIIGWLKSQGVAAKPSSAGRNAEQVLHAVGNTWGSWIFADENTVKLLEKMAKTIRQTHDGALEEYPDRTATVQEWKQLMHRRSQRQALPKISIENFTESNVLQIGLTVSCPHCTKENWYGLTTLDYTLTCERCLREFRFPQGGLHYGEKDWRYRVVGPFSLPDYALGVYATVLTLRVFRENLRGGETPMTSSTGLDLEYKDVKCEIDFVAWYQEGEKFWIDPEPALVFGETKSFGEEIFHQRDVARLKTLAELFPSAFFVLSAMKKDFGEAERARMRAFAEWGRVPTKNGQPRASIIILTGNELFAEHSIKNAWEKLGGRHAALIKNSSVHLDDLWTLAELTQQLYLDMPSYWDWLSKRHKHRRKR